MKHIYEFIYWITNRMHLFHLAINVLLIFKGMIFL